MQQFNDANFSSEVLQSEKPVVVDFWSTGCGTPCADTLAILHTLEPQYPHDKFGTLLTNDNPVTTQQYAVVITPTLIFFKDGVEVNRLAGAQAQSQAAIVAALDALNPGPAPDNEANSVAVEQAEG